MDSHLTVVGVALIAAVLLAANQVCGRIALQYGTVPQASIVIFPTSAMIIILLATVVARDISLFFGRLIPTADDKGNQSLAELYERQIYMTFEQAEDLARMLVQTAQMSRAKKAEAAARQPSQGT